MRQSRAKSVDDLIDEMRGRLDGIQERYYSNAGLKHPITGSRFLSTKSHKFIRTGDSFMQPRATNVSSYTTKSMNKSTGSNSNRKSTGVRFYRSKGFNFGRKNGSSQRHRLRSRPRADRAPQKAKQFENRFTNGKRFLKNLTNDIKDDKQITTARTRDQTDTNFSSTTRRINFSVNLRSSASLSRLAQNLKVENERSRMLKEHSNSKFNRKIDLLKHRIGKSRDILKDIKDQFKFNKEKFAVNSKVYSNRSMNSFNRLGSSAGKFSFNNKERSKYSNL